MREMSLGAPKHQIPIPQQMTFPVPAQRQAFQNLSCNFCKNPISPHEARINYKGKLYHDRCFVCEQCFRPFEDNEVYEYDGHRYCEHDYKMLFANQCARCDGFVLGRGISALGREWHVECFTCQADNCKYVGSYEYADLTWYGDRVLCPKHFDEERAKKEGKPICQKCFLIIEAKPLRFRGDPYHAFHFNCSTCGVDLDHKARDVGGRLYCLPCHDKMGIPICAACRRPIEGRCVNALGKQWHPEHFVCVTCERPFSNSKYFLGPNNLPYCEMHYNALYGDVCNFCNRVIQDQVISALEKRYCEKHFRCCGCFCQMAIRDKFVEFDMKPLCRKCFDKFPSELKKRIKKNASKK